MGWLINVFRVVTGIGSTLMILSLIPTVYQIHKAKTTGHMPITPLATMLVNCHLWLTYGFLTHNYVPLVATFSLGDALSVVYLSIYYRHTHDRKYARKVITACVVVITVVTMYAVLGAYGCTGQSHTGVTDTMGYIGTTAAVLLYGSPFEDIAKVFKYHSGVFIPITMVVVGVVNNSIWVIYSLLVRDNFLLAANSFVTTMGLVQATVYWAFNPRTHPLPAEFQKLEEVKDIESGNNTATVVPVLVTSKSPARAVEPLPALRPTVPQTRRS